MDRTLRTKIVIQKCRGGELDGSTVETQRVSCRLRWRENENVPPDRGVGFVMAGSVGGEGRQHQPGQRRES